MIDITVLNNKFEESGKIQTEVSLTPENIHVPVVHSVVKATLAGRRQGNACTKTRAEASGGGAKPFKQKGTGRARQGSKRSSIQVGGGRAFGPKPRSYDQKMNKKVTLKAIQSVLADKLQAGKLTVVEKIESTGKTKEMYTMLNSKGLLPALVVTADKANLAIRATKNLQWGKAMAVEGFSVYEAVKFENLVIEQAALETLLKRLGQIMAHVEEILVKPLITEKASKGTEKFNRYAFIVNLKANKNQIKNAIEHLYDVKVLNVKTSIAPGKIKRAGKSVKKTSKLKKAFVQLEEGQRIEFFKGV